MVVRSFINQAAGNPVARVAMATIRYIHAMPRCWMSASSIKLLAAPPNPLPANMRPVARPRLLLKYCVEMAVATYAG